MPSYMYYEGDRELTNGMASCPHQQLMTGLSFGTTSKNRDSASDEKYVYMCMYVCMCICVCVCVYVCIYVCINNILSWS